MLTDVAIRPHTRGILKHHALFAMLTGDDVDNAGYRITTIEGTRGTLHDFYLLDVVRVDKTQVVLASIISV